MIFELFDINGKSVSVHRIISYEIISEVAAVCDGLRLHFVYQKKIGEICVVKAYSGGKLIFNGFCDKQKMTFGKSGGSCFIYARSSAALLVDNEAIPCQYSNPSARQLWFTNAKDLGFECCLPEICSEHSYLVPKGTSCYGAINNYVSAVCKAPVYATPENELKIYEESSDVKSLEDYKLISLLHIINRSVLISDIDYKINSADNYSYHFKSVLAEKMGIKRRRLYNLSSVPLWQREITAEKKINSALEEYYCISAELAGDCDFHLYDRVYADLNILSDREEFYVSEIVKSKNKNGEKTAVILKKKINGELINYVA